VTLLESVLGAALLTSLFTLTVVIKYAQREHRLRLKKATGAFRLGGSQKIGDLSQLLGTFHTLAEYDEISLLSSTSAQSSMDLLGRKGNKLDFIEFKKAGTPLTSSEKALKTYIDAGQLRVSYRVIEVAWPDGIRVQERT
jgi:hypothetical protein